MHKFQFHIYTPGIAPWSLTRSLTDRFTHPYKFTGQTTGAKNTKFRLKVVMKEIPS